MKYEIIDCIDAGSEYCPCHLAETGDCILCSELNSKTFCDCINWKGTCIYQEYIWNGNKAKNGRKHYLCNIVDKKKIDNKLIILTIKVPYDLSQSLVRPGSFVFLRNPSCEEYFNAPISIMDIDTLNNTITVAIEVVASKTKKIDELNKNQDILVKAPYWNGVLGVRHILNAKKGNSIIIARAIGLAPMIPIMKKLCANDNNVTLILDKAEYNENFVEDYIKLYNVKVIECSTFNCGELTNDLKKILQNIVNKYDINLIHCSGADILIYKVMEYLGDDFNYSCCNNAKMCCGEGVCGACTARFKGHIVKRLCKLQVDPKYIFEGRRLI
ncbi:sulfide/dihydroorotate dehydrogenase-like FAD/NAD-binding protein [Clostridium thermopalmarium]|uniref:Dihydroorotate dehydrogenase B, electron transfer subunit n=1 Tax=Clostridium thermopalmarium DSM 5974 TaxID=1121340 RepID=A0A2T0AWX3_9CLOT|nr:sulfide/dihydroorotate dehydrogenase-like FAD/NAD-binding protein [Clostridium thermopalmarium]MBE6042702.1 sulfide/dihydroorotate dehydrogenase-like FAD/NAD-binding protein [Clostridium thermopalmarium]MBE6078997.1 sulfide/dihydroorotate dehydrogenase-like FAD/NAD-binding protein [Clostridium lundense]PRR75221.1 Dihydroorotate dehydrogenase B, electron transfer subunit [Clostridium thermopalmarium DSM 5974]PVZ27977.1 NAD(P)H-flavin reductase [Clostridium thermopalmarium DSM 5974]